MADSDRDALNPTGRSDAPGVNFRTIWTVLVIAAVVVFIVQNTDSTQVEFLFLSFDLAVWLLVVVSMLLGASVGWVWRRGRRKRDA